VIGNCATHFFQFSLLLLRLAKMRSAS